MCVCVPEYKVWQHCAELILQKKKWFKFHADAPQFVSLRFVEMLEQQKHSDGAGIAFVRENDHTTPAMPDDLHSPLAQSTVKKEKLDVDAENIRTDSLLFRGCRDALHL